MEIFGNIQVLTHRYLMSFWGAVRYSTCCPAACLRKAFIPWTSYAVCDTQGFLIRRYTIRQ